MEHPHDIGHFQLRRAAILQEFRELAGSEESHPNKFCRNQKHPSDLDEMFVFFFWGGGGSDRKDVFCSWLQLDFCFKLSSATVPQMIIPWGTTPFRQPQT